MDYLTKLVLFVTGKISADEMEEALYERLSELRETPELTREQELLSSLELAVEEAREGLRPMAEAIARGRQVWDEQTAIQEIGPRDLRITTSSADTTRLEKFLLRPTRPTETITVDLGLVGAGI